jgi:voltage-gated potassium channel Kch
MILKSIFTFLKDEQYRSLLLATFIVLTIGSIVYHYVEGWGWLDSLYFSVITLTTIGYGDFSPQTDLGKFFTILYIIVGVGLILGFINTVYGHFRDKNQDRWAKKTPRK